MTAGRLRVLVAGWFSFNYGHATAGDLLARDLACSWLAKAGFAYDVALAPPFSGGVSPRKRTPNYIRKFCSVSICGGRFFNAPRPRPRHHREAASCGEVRVPKF